MPQEKSKISLDMQEKNDSTNILNTKERSNQSGVYIFSNGDRYEGEFFQEAPGLSIQRHGCGRHIGLDGTLYDGSWVHDSMEGNGCIKFPNGASYEGQFAQNKFHGRGKFTFPNTSFYTGSFVCNKLEGCGEFTDTNCQTWTGLFNYKSALDLKYKPLIE